MYCSGAASEAVAATTVVNSIAPELVSFSTTCATVERYRDYAAVAGAAALFSDWNDCR